MNIQRDVDPQKDAELNKSLDAKFGKERRNLVKGSSVRTLQSLLKRAATARKQFEDNSFNKPKDDVQMGKGPIDEARERAEELRERRRRGGRSKVTKHGSHDQSTHGKGKKGGGSSEKPSSSRSRSSQRDDVRGPKDAKPTPETARRNASIRGIKQRLGMKTKDLISSYGRGKDKPMTPDNPEGFLMTRRGKRRYPGRAERNALMNGLNMPGARSAWAREVKRGLKRKLKEFDEKMTKHQGHADQSVHSPTGRAAQAKKPSSSNKPRGESSKAPSKVRVRSAVEGAKQRVQQAGRSLAQNKERFQRISRDIDAVLDGLDSGTRLYRELKEAKRELMGEKDEKVTKAKMTPTEIKEAKRLAERLKGKEGIDNPHALARWQVQQGKKVYKHGSHDQSSHDPTQGGGKGSDPRLPSSDARNVQMFAIRNRGWNSYSKDKRTQRAVEEAASKGEVEIDRETRQFRYKKKSNNKVTKAPLTIDEARERHEELHESQRKVSKSIEKGIGHSLEVLTGALKHISQQEPDKEISEADEKKLQELIDEILGVAGYLETVKEQGHFEKQGDVAVPSSAPTDRPTFTSPATNSKKRNGKS